MILYGNNVYLRQVAVALDDPTKFRMIALQGFENYGAEFKLGDSFPATDGGTWNLQNDPAYPAANVGGVAVPARIWAQKVGSVASSKALGMIKASASVQIASDGTATVAPGVGLGSVTQVTADPASPLSVSNISTTPQIAMTQVSSTTSGWLSAADYNLIMSFIGGITSQVDGGSASSTDTGVTITDGTATSVDSGTAINDGTAST